jgi:hypothetical protein
MAWVPFFAKETITGLHTVQQNKWNIPVEQITHLKLKITFHNISNKKSSGTNYYREIERACFILLN